MNSKLQWAAKAYIVLMVIMAIVMMCYGFNQMSKQRQIDQLKAENVQLLQAIETKR